MSEENTAAKPAKKTAATKGAESVQYKCTVLAQPNDEPVTLAGLVCGAGKVLTLSEAKAKAAEKEGWVKINGLA